MTSLEEALMDWFNGLLPPFKEPKKPKPPTTQSRMAAALGLE